MAKFSDKVLVVDDDRRILSALKRQLYRHFNLTLAESGADAIAIVRNEGPFAVIVTDMRMPGMDGIEVLKQVCEIAPLSTRIMLTGNSDQDTAVSAVNEGRVFKFHTKPCDAKDLAHSIKQGIEDYGARCEQLEEQQRLEQTLVETTTRVDQLQVKAKAADRAQSTFLANMNHELRTPLNHVIGFAEALKLDPSSEFSQENIAYLNHIADSGQALLETINRILTASQLTADSRLDRKPVCLTDIVGAVVESVRASAKEKEIELMVTTSCGEEMVLVDPPLLTRAIEELVANAIKFNCTGGEVDVAVEREEHDQIVILRVRDTGPGMSADDLVKAMQPFSQIDDGLNRQYEGVGLGLTLTQAVVEAHGGELVMESEPGRGTVVNLRLPLAVSAANQKSATISAA